MFEAWNVAKGRKVQGGRILSQGTVFRIPSTLNQHGDHSIMQRDAIPSGLCLVGLYNVFFNRTMTQHTSRLCKDYLTKKESDEVLQQMTWPPQSSNLNPIEMVWDELDYRVKDKQPTSAVGTYSRLLEKHSSWNWLRECQECAKLSSRQRVATLKNLKSIFICLTLFWLLHDSICVIS